MVKYISLMCFIGDNQRTEYYEVKYDADNKILEFEETIWEFDGNEIPPGQYSFPYNFVLPSNVPASAYYTGSERAVGYIKYKVTAKFKAENGNDVKDLKAKCHLVVRQMAPSSAFNISANEIVEIKKCCCCCSLGICKLECNFERNVYHSLETARAMVNIDNSKCSTGVKKTVMKLRQIVTLKADGNEFKRDFTVVKQSFDGVEKKGTDHREVEINLAESKQPFHQFDHDDIKPLDASQSQLAEFLQPTTNGKLVNIQYVLEVVCRMKDVQCIYDEPNCIINMFLQPPWLPNYAPLQAPPGWQPVIYDPRQIPMPPQINNPGIPQVHPGYDPNVPQPQGPPPAYGPGPPPAYGPGPPPAYGPGPPPPYAPGPAPAYGPGPVPPPGVGQAPAPLQHPDHPEESNSGSGSDGSDESDKSHKAHKVIDKGDEENNLKIDEEVMDSDEDRM
jgi:hypothetical protein